MANDPGESAPTPFSATDATVAEGSAGRRVEHLALPRGAHVGRYTVLGEVGRGAMGAVYAAYDPELDRRIALKVLHGEGGHEKAQRLIREARALASFNHPNVVTVHDVGVFQARGFIATEFIDGQTLRDWLDEDERSVGEILEVMRQAGRGLAAAHAAGIVHRDFKPHNVMVDRAGRVIVMDFGLARRKGEEMESSTGRHLLDSENTDGSTRNESTPPPVDLSPSRELGLTTTGAVMGTPAYMSLEQHRGRPASAASDQYSFCVTLFEALTGGRPFVGPRRMAVAFAIKEGRREPWPSSPAVPSRVRRAVERGLRATPEQRWPSMEALLEQLAPPRRGRFVGLAVGASVATVLSVGAFAWLGQPAPEDPCIEAGRAATGAWGDAQREEVAAAFIATKVPYAKATAERVTSALDEYATDWQQGRKQSCVVFEHAQLQSEVAYHARVRCYERALEELDALVEVLAGADAAMIRRATDAVAGLPDLGRCEDVDALLDAVPEPDDPRLAQRVSRARRMLVDVRAARLAGDDEAARASLDRVAAAVEDLGASFRPLRAEFELERGAVLADASDFAGAAAAHERAYMEARRSGHDPVALDAATSSIYLVGYRLADYPRGELWAELARAEADRVGPQTEHHARILGSSGILHGRQGRFEEARAHYLEAKALYESLGETSGSSYDAMYTNLGLVSINLGEGEQARAYLVEALERIQARYGERHPRTAKSLANLASASLLLGDIEAARAEATLAVERAVSAHGSEHASVGAAQELLARAALAAGDLEIAHEAIAAAARNAEQTLGEGHPATAERWAREAEIELLRGRPDAAVKPAERAYVSLKSRFGEADARTGEAGSVLAGVKLAGGDFERAAELAVRVYEALDAEAAANRVARARALLVLASLTELGRRVEGESRTAVELRRDAQALIARSGAMGAHLQQRR